MKYIQKIIMGVVLTIMLLNMGCRKCYLCYQPQGIFTAHKGNDSIQYLAISQRAITDSLRYFNNLGYTIDTFAIYYNPLNNGDQICAHSDYKAAINEGDSCVESFRN